MLREHAPSCKTTAVMARVSQIETTMHWSLICGKRMAAPGDESIEEHQLGDPADDTSQTSGMQARLVCLFRISRKMQSYGISTK